MCTAASCGFKVFYLLRNCWSEQESLHPASSTAHWQGESGIISSCLVVKEKWTRSCSPQHFAHPWLFQLINFLVADCISEIPNHSVPEYSALLRAVLWIVQGKRYSQREGHCERILPVFHIRRRLGYHLLVGKVHRSVRKGQRHPTASWPSSLAVTYLPAHN